jgi:Ankyrin repeats (3 copies)
MKYAKKTRAVLQELIFDCMVKRAIKAQNWDRVVRILRDKLPRLKRVSKTGTTLLHRAMCRYPPVDVIEALHACAPEMIVQQDIFGRTPFHEACRYNTSQEVVDFLIKNQPETIYLRDKLGRIPLHYAMDKGFGYQPLKVDAIFIISIKAPGLLNLCDCRGETPLDVLCRGRSRREVRWLLDFLEPMAASYDYMSLESTCTNFLDSDQTPCNVTVDLTHNYDELPDLEPVDKRIDQMTRMIESGAYPSIEQPLVTKEFDEHLLPGLEPIDTRLQKLAKLITKRTANNSALSVRRAKEIIKSPNIILKDDKLT